VFDIAVGSIDDPIRPLANVATPFLAVFSDPLSVFIHRQKSRAGMNRVCRARTVSVDNAKARLLCFTARAKTRSMQTSYFARVERGDLVAFSVDGNPVPLTVLS
jgi:hypothetical protein